MYVRLCQQSYLYVRQNAPQSLTLLTNRQKTPLYTARAE
jgi:hypothetical protein